MSDSTYIHPLHTTRNMMTSSKDGNCVSEDCIPFSQINSSVTAELDASDDGVDKGNGKTPPVWTTTTTTTTSGNRHRYSPFSSSVTTHRYSWRCLWVLCFVLLLLLIVFICLWAVQRNKIQVIPCLEPRCIKASAEILNHIDLTLSPCDSFYQYACNNWIRNNHIPSGHNTWSILRKLTRNIEYFTKDLLENKSLENVTMGLRLAQAHYNSCMNESWINHRGFEPLFRQLLHLFNGWILLPPDSLAARPDNDTFLTTSQFNLTQLYLPSFIVFGGIPLFRIGIGQELGNSSHFLIEISEGVVSLHRENYINETYPAYMKQTSAFRAFMRNYSKILGVPDEYLVELDAVYEFEKQIAMRTEERTDRDIEKNNELITLPKLYEICPVLDWHTMISKIMEPTNYTVDKDEAIVLSDRDFFRDRCKLYTEYLSNETGIRILHNAAVWQFLWRTVGKMPTVVSRAMEDYKEAEFGLRTDPERWQTCVMETQSQYGMVIGRVFVNEKFDKNSKIAATEMINEIREAFKENFATVEWMQEEDKKKAIEKVNAMKASVGYPDYINDPSEEERAYALATNVSVLTYLENFLLSYKANMVEHLRLLITKDKDRWELSPHIVNAFYKENANHIYFPAAILQRPVYDHEYPMSLNFGGIGMVVGHEITHAFDQYGSKRDAAGNLRQWWSNETREAFERNSQCMIDQYSNYSILNTSLNGKMTLGENIADNGGIKAAYKAFKKLEAKYSDRPILPGLNFTSDQLFFISFAQIWCVKQLPRSIMNTVLFDVHTIDQYRVIGTLSNSEDFARAFNCPVGSPMNPAKKCVVW